MSRPLAHLARGVVILTAVSSYFAYTTAGFDFEANTTDGAEVTYYRLRWDDGATWVGRVVQPVMATHQPPDWFDPGGTFLAAPSRPDHWPNRLGCWAIAWASDDPFVPLRYPGAVASAWVGVPSWLVILGLWPRRVLGGMIWLIRQGKLSFNRTSSTP